MREGKEARPQNGGGDPTPPGDLDGCENKGVARKGVCKSMKIYGMNGVTAEMANALPANAAKSVAPRLDMDDSRTI